MANDKVELEFIADTSGVERGFDKVDRGLDEIDQATQKASRGVETFFGVFTGSVAAGAFTEFSRRIVDAFAGIPDLIERGAGIDDITSSFNNLSEAAGVVGDAFVKDLSTALSDTIPKVDLMQKANELMLGGLKPDQIELVAKAARTLGEVTGTSAAEGMDQFADSLLRGNDRALKTLGIVVDNDKAILNYATSIGKATDKLTEQEKVEALRAASLDALAQNTEKLGAVTDDAGDVIAQISTALQNQADEALKTIGTNQDLQTALEGLRDTIKEVDFGPLIGALGTVITKAAEAASALISFTDKAAAAIGRSTGEYKVLDDQLVKITNTLGVGTVEATKKAEEQFNQLVAAMNQGTDKSVALAIGKDLEFVRLQIEDTKRQYGLLAPEIKKVEKATQSNTNTNRVAVKTDQEIAKAISEKEKFLKQYSDALQKQAKDLEKIVLQSFGYRDILAEIKEGTIDAATAGERIKAIYQQTAPQLNELNALQDVYNKMLEKMARGANVASEDLGKVASEIERVKEEMEAALGEASSGGSFLDLLVGQGLDPGQSQVASAIGSALSSAITEAINSGDVGSAIKNAGSSMGQALGTAAGASLGPIGAAVGGAIGQAMADKFIKGVSNLGKSTSGTGKGIKTIVDSIFPGIGSGIDALVGDKLFGGDSEGTETRKQIDKFFADAFDAQRLLVIINGQLEQIKDLDLGGGLFGDSSSGAAEFFSTLAADAQNGFSAVAAGFTQMMGLGSEAAIGLAQAFADNLGGSLNNLQLLVESTGLSFEQMREQVVSAFLDGKLSALEAQNALNGIAQVSQKGIPDGIGLVSTAFDNLKAAGTKGGRALVDALQDVGFEAKELGQKDLTQVMATLAATGKYSSEEIKQVFDSLARAGITSVDQLTSATTQELLPVLADLENTKFPFAEQLNDVKEYAKAVNEIPDVKDVELRVRVSYPSSADQQVVENLSRRGGEGQATL